MGHRPLSVLSEVPLREYPCPFCSKQVRADDSNLTVAHELPVCADFVREINQSAWKNLEAEQPKAVAEGTEAESR